MCAEGKAHFGRTQGGRVRKRNGDWMTNKAITSCMLILLPAGLLWAAEQVRVSVDPEARKQAEIAVREAQQDGNAAATLRACRRWLEFYPNEPIVQAGIYRAMSLVAEESGDAAQAQVWGTTARQLDPAFEMGLQDDAPAMRGGADKLAAVLAGVAATEQTDQPEKSIGAAANGCVPSSAGRRAGIPSAALDAANAGIRATTISAIGCSAACADVPATTASDPPTNAAADSPAGSRRSV